MQGGINMLLGIVILISVILIACNVYYDTDVNETQKKDVTKRKFN